MGLILVAADWLWSIYEAPLNQRWIAWLLALIFMPTIFVIRSGQIGAFILFGSVAFLGLLKQGRCIAAGAVTVLLAIKPHLVYLVWVVLVIQGLRLNSRILAGGLAVGLVASLIPLTTNPSVYHDYWEAMTERPPSQWHSPTLGTVIRLMTEDRQFRLQFVPSLLGIVWLMAWGWRNRNTTWNWQDAFPSLLLVSFATASYGAWPFDLVLLLPAVIQRAAQISQAGDRPIAIRAIVIFSAINFAAADFECVADRFVLVSMGRSGFAGGLLVAWREHRETRQVYAACGQD